MKPGEREKMHFKKSIHVKKEKVLHKKSNTKRTGKDTVLAHNKDKGGVPEETLEQVVLEVHHLQISEKSPV
jgi:hypothetical protein